MPSPVSSRLLEFLKYKGMTLNELSVKLGYGNNRDKLYRLERSEDANPSLDTIQDIAEAFPELNLVWWLRGAGTMLNGEEETPYQSIILDNPKITDKEKIAYLLKLLNSLKMENDLLKDDLKVFKSILRHENFMNQDNQSGK